MVPDYSSRGSTAQNDNPRVPNNRLEVEDIESEE